MIISISRGHSRLQLMQWGGPINPIINRRRQSLHVPKLQNGHMCFILVDLLYGAAQIGHSSAINVSIAINFHLHAQKESGKNS